MRIRVFSTPAAAANALASAIARALARQPSLVLGLPTGQTPIPLYASLARLYGEGRADFSRARTFNLDEFVGVGPAGTGSYRAFMERHLFGRVNLRPSRINFLHGAARDTFAECARYERAIVRAGGIDLQILGLGPNGHIGFNEPDRTLIATTHRTRLRAATRRSNAELFGGRLAAVPREALSMGMATILRARRIVLLATGRAKAASVAAAVAGPITTALPASLLQLHGNVEIWVDRAAAGRLASRSAT